MEFFSGFNWAIPTAFSEAVSLCRFEEGDTLYDTEKAYDGEWAKASKNIEYSLQVRYPTRASHGAKENGVGIFSRNWTTEVRLDLYRHLEILDSSPIVTTQGRLYTALWKGDLKVLHLDSAAPQAPLNVQQVTRKLGEASEVAKGLSIGYPVFVMARDPSNPVSRDKYSKVISKLRKHLTYEPKLMTPQSAGIRDWVAVAPTIDVAFFQINGLSADELHGLIKEAVYSPAKDAKKDMFRLSSHGLIF